MILREIEILEETRTRNGRFRSKRNITTDDAGGRFALKFFGQNDSCEKESKHKKKNYSRRRRLMLSKIFQSRSEALMY